MQQGKLKGIKKKLENFRRNIRAEIGEYSFKYRNVTIMGPPIKDGDTMIDEQLRQNVASWLISDEKLTLTMGQVKETFDCETLKVDSTAKLNVKRLMKQMASSDLVDCCKKIDTCTGEIGLVEVGKFVYKCIHKFALRGVTLTSPKARVLFAMLIDVIHRSLGPQIPIHILVHFMDDLDRTLENIKSNGNSSSHKLDNMISFVCYLIAVESCSPQFLETVLTKIAECTEDAAKHNLKRILRMVKSVFDKPTTGQNEIEKILAPYRRSVDDDDSE